jgi:hypothetical protein
MRPEFYLSAIARSNRHVLSMKLDPSDQNPLARHSARY